MTGKWGAVERDAKALHDDILTGRRATFTCSDADYSALVIARLKERLRGDLTPRGGDDNSD